MRDVCGLCPEFFLFVYNMLGQKKRIQRENMSFESLKDRLETCDIPSSAQATRLVSGNMSVSYNLINKSLLLQNFMF